MQPSRDSGDRHVTVGEAYRSLHLGFGLVLMRIGKGWVVALELAICAAMIASVPLFANPIVIVAGVVALLGMSLWQETNLEDWVDEHNARVDAQIRRERASADGAGAGPADPTV